MAGGKVYASPEQRAALLEVYEETNYPEVATLQGLAAGTILYVVMFEVLNREKAKEISGLGQLLGIIVGFVAMLLLDIFGKQQPCPSLAPEGNLGLLRQL